MAALLQALPGLRVCEASCWAFRLPLGFSSLLYSNFWLQARIDNRYIPCPHEYNRGRSAKSR